MIRPELYEFFIKKLLMEPIPTTSYSKFRRHVKLVSNRDKRNNYREIMLEKYRLSMQENEEKNKHIMLARKLTTRCKKAYKKEQYEKRMRIIARRSK